MNITAAHKWYAGAAAAALGVLGAGYFLLVSPQQSAAAETTDQAASAHQANVAAQTQINALKAQYKDLPTLQGQVAVIRARIPQTPEEPTLLRSLSKLAKSSGVTLVSLQVQTPAAMAQAQPAAASSATNGSTLSQIPLTIEVTGTFANTRLFIAGLEGLRRSVLVTGVNATREAADPNGTTAAARAGGIRSSITGRVFMSNAAVTPTVGGAAASSGSTSNTNQPS